MGQEECARQEERSMTVKETSCAVNSPSLLTKELEEK